MFPFDAMPFYGSFVSDEVDALRESGVEVDVLFINGKTNKLNYLASPWQLRSRMAAADFDIIHVHHSFMGYVAKFQKGVPIVWTFHEGEIAGSAEDAREEPLARRLAHSKGFKQHVAQRVDSVIVVADYLKAPLGRLDAHTIPAGVNTALFKPQNRDAARKTLGLEANGVYVLFPSAPARPGKRYDLARAAVDALPSDMSGVELIALDDVAHEQVPLYMNASNVMLMTSAFEASPVTVREALACDLPVVSTAVGDVPVLAKRVTGCTSVDDDDPATLAVALESVLRQGQTADGGAVREEYSLQRTAQRIITVYENVLEERKAKRS